MTENSKYINAVERIRIDKGLCHFTLGQWGPSNTGEPEFNACVKAVMTEEDAYNLFKFMLTKVNGTKIDETFANNKAEISSGNVDPDIDKVADVDAPKIEIKMTNASSGHDE